MKQIQVSSREEQSSLAIWSHRYLGKIFNVSMESRGLNMEKRLSVSQGTCDLFHHCPPGGYSIILFSQMAFQLLFLKHGLMQLSRASLHFHELCSIIHPQVPISCFVSCFKLRKIQKKIFKVLTEVPPPPPLSPTWVCWWCCPPNSQLLVRHQLCRGDVDGTDLLEDWFEGDLFEWGKEWNYGQ